MFGFYINCRKTPFIDMILARTKLDETRPKNVLKPLVGKRVDMIETGKGTPTIRATAVIRSARIVPYEDIGSRAAAGILGTEYDIQPGKRKVFYELTSVHRIKPRKVPANHVNHGRSYAEYERR